MMDEALVLQVDNLGKRYAVAGDERWALRHISFNLPRATTLGVVGPNGAGKSTLIKILAGIEPPSEGLVIGRGRLLSMSSLRLGFTQESSVRDAAITQAAFHGIPAHEVLDVLEYVLDWCELRVTPTQRLYQMSDGMVDRIAFGLGIFLKPELLIADGRLAVGDAFFRERCIERVEKLIAEGMSLILASHDRALVNRFCQDLLVLESGRIVESSPWRERFGLGRVDSAIVDEEERTAVESIWESDTLNAVDYVDDQEDEAEAELANFKQVQKDASIDANAGVLFLAKNDGVAEEPHQDGQEPLVIDLVVDTNENYPFRLLADFLYGDQFAFRVVSPEMVVGQRRQHLQLTLAAGLLHSGGWRCAAMLANMSGKSATANFEVIDNVSGNRALGDWTGRMPGPITPVAEWVVTPVKGISIDHSDILAANKSGAIQKVTLIAGEGGDGLVSAVNSLELQVNFKVSAEMLPVRCCLDFARGKERAFRVLMPKVELLSRGAWCARAILPPDLLAEGFYDINAILVFSENADPPPLAAYGVLRIHVNSPLLTGARRGWGGAMPGVVMPKAEWCEISGERFE